MVVRYVLKNSFLHCCHYISHCSICICFGDLLGVLLGVLHFGLRGLFRFLSVLFWSLPVFL